MVNFNGLYNKEIFGDKLNQGNYFPDKKLHFKIIENGTILPHKQLIGVDGVGFGGIIDSRGNFVEESFLNPNADGAYTPYGEVEHYPGTVIYLGMFVNIWGHSLTDNLKRVWFLQSDVYRKYFKNCPIVYNKMWYGIVPQFARILEILGVDLIHLYQIERPMQFQNVILPDESTFYVTDKPGGGGFSSRKNLPKQ